jgi:multidrug efflux pump
MIRWIQACLKNKLLVYIGAIAICLAGLFSIVKAPLVPFVQAPSSKIWVNISYPGANAQTISEQILKQLIPNLQTVDHVESIVSQTSSGGTILRLSLYDGLTDLQMIQTQMEVMQAISGANLPSSVPTPDVKIVGGGYSLLIVFEVLSKTLSVFDLNNFVQAVLEPKFSALPGVITEYNSNDPGVSIALNPVALTRFQLNPLDVSKTIDENSQLSPLGDLFISEQDYPLNLQTNSASLYHLNHMLIGYTSPASAQMNQSNKAPNYLNGAPIYLSDIANIAFIEKPSAYQKFSSFNGESDSAIELFTRNDANPLEVSKETQSFLHSIADTLPADMKIIPILDESIVMTNSIHEVAVTIAIACILVIMVAFIFLGRFKTTLISLVAIPICLLGAVIYIAASGGTINILTLLALVIAVGLVVDDAIVVVENITRYIEMGYKRYDAVIEGTNSIAMTIIGITLTLLAVYLPLTFIQSVIVDKIKPFALTLAAAVFISGIVALTITPVVSFSLISDAKENRYQQWFHKVLDNIIHVYHSILKVFLTYAKTALMGIVFLLAVGGFFALKLPRMIYPHDPRGIINIELGTTPTDTIDSIQKKFLLFENFYKDPKVAYYSEEIGSNQSSSIQSLYGNIDIIYKDAYLKKISSITDSINSYIKKNNITNAHANMEDFSSFRGNADISFYLYSSGSVEQNNALADKLAKALGALPAFSSSDAEIEPAKKQISFSIDQEKALSVGITRSDITQLISTYYGGYRLHNDFSIDGLTVPVRVTIDLADLKNPDFLQKLTIHSPLTNLNYPLSEFVTMSLIAQPEAIETFNGLPSVEIDLNLNPGHSMGEAINVINEMAKQITPNAQIYYIDSAQMYLKGSSQTIWIAALGLISIYFLLTILFKNLIDPFIILLTVPCTVIGGALSLYLIGGSINIYSTLGLITLIGLITKHGILIVRFANEELLKGKSVIQATLEATRHRFRPILMTTLAMVMGALPLLLSDKMMYVSRKNLAIVIIGGLLIGTLFSLVIIPVVYSLIKKAEQSGHDAMLPH